MFKENLFLMIIYGLLFLFFSFILYLILDGYDRELSNERIENYQSKFFDATIRQKNKHSCSVIITAKQQLIVESQSCYSTMPNFQLINKGSITDIKACSKRHFSIIASENDALIKFDISPCKE